MQSLSQTRLTEKQFAQIVGRMRLYQSPTVFRFTRFTQTFSTRVVDVNS